MINPVQNAAMKPRRPSAMQFFVLRAISLLAAVALYVACGAGSTLAQDAGDVPESPRYHVTGIELSYRQALPGQIDLDELSGLEIPLGVGDDGLTAPGEADEQVLWQLGAPVPEPQYLYPAALRSICSRIVKEFNRRRLLGVFVYVSNAHISPQTGEDLREEGDTVLELIVLTTSIAEVRTIASGERVREEDRINSPLHSRIREKSPLQESDILQEQRLDSYIYRLNRHPGRSVSSAISAADEPGTAILDYMVAENKPWLLYLQISNTGTEATAEWQQRIGVSHTQLTGHDDIASLDYITTAFDEVHFVLGSYTIPVKWLYSDFRAYGRWNKYTASDVGPAEQDFKGRGWQAGGELKWNLLQYGPLFVDVYGGARWEENEVENVMFDIRGRENFFLPYLGLMLERHTRKARTSASIDVERNLSGVAGTDKEGIERLGRFPVERNWTVLQWRARHSFFLEPLLMPRRFEDADTPRSSTLAHGVSVEFLGQHAFGDRLIPQAQQVVGGAYTVRGYPQSVAAGDDVYVLRTEYRYHIPRAFTPSPAPGRLPLFGRPFRYAPQHPYGQPDWDLAVKAFYDFGRALRNDRMGFEENRTLMGAGLGLELEVLRNLHARVEWGHALRKIEGQQDVRRGNNEIHVGVTLMY